MRHPRFSVHVVAAFALLVAGSAAPPAAQAATPQEGALLAQAVAKAEAGDWTGAAFVVGRSRSAVASEVVLWLRLRDGHGSWQEYGDFLARNPDWPSLAILRRHAERAMPADLPAETTLAFFADEPPLSGTGALRLAAALEATGRAEAGADEAVRAWWEFSLTPAERAALLDGHGEALAEHHVERLDMLLWRGLGAEAATMLPLDDPLALAMTARPRTRNCRMRRSKAYAIVYNRESARGRSETPANSARWNFRRCRRDSGAAPPRRATAHSLGAR